MKIINLVNPACPAIAQRATEDNPVKKFFRRGFSLMEVLVTLAVVLILVGALIGTGSYVRTRANIDLTRGLLEELSTALEEYYNDQAPNAFPFDTPDTSGNGFLGDDYLDGDLIDDVSVGIGGTISSALPTHPSAEPVAGPISSASSTALFYFLDRNSASRATVEAVPNTLITNKDAAGNDIRITLATGIIDLPRYIDPWKTSIRYVYLAGTAFPTLTSAGPDKIFDTPDDITSQ